MRLDKLKSEAGFTFIEVALTGIIIVATTIGLMYGMINVTKNYQNDYLRMGLYRYGNLVMDELSRDFALATSVNITRWFDGTDHVTLHVVDPGGTPHTVTYSADEDRGVLANGNPLPRHRGNSSSTSHATFEFPSFGEYFGGSGERKVTVESFTVESWLKTSGDPWVHTNQQIQSAAQDFYMITLRLAYQFKATNGKTVKRYEDFQRRAFMTKAYIR